MRPAYPPISQLIVRPLDTHEFNINKNLNMGGRLWHYFVPHDNDVSAALQRLRRDVFARGDYETDAEMTPNERKALLDDMRPELDPWVQKTQELSAGLPPGLADLYAGAAEQFRDELMKDDVDLGETEKTPETIEELLEMRAESGTSSILDMTHVSEEPEFGAVCPMPVERVREIFGTDKPTRKMVESKVGYPELADDDPVIMEGWQGCYFTVYRDGKPHEIFFVGSSGD
ncbi:MAG: hypothetical protein ACTHLW_21810 [Verrucomicrobiota bacterium]